MISKFRKRLLPLLVAVAAAGAAQAEMAANGAAEMEKAALDLIALAKASPESPPRLTEPKAKADFAKLLDRKAIIGTPPYKAADMQQLQSAFGGYFALTKMYMNFRDPAGKTSFADNEFLYQDELIQLAAAMIDTAGAMSEALNDEVTGKPADTFSEQRKSELAKLRMGISQMFTGALTVLKNPRYSKENKVLIASSLAGNALTFRGIMSIPERINIAGAVPEAMLQTPPEAEESMNLFKSALESEDCTGLCALK